MQWADGFIAVDWGTTNRRAWLLDGAGACLAEFEDDRGVLAVQGRFPEAVAEIRSRLADYPLLMAGMVGSNRGWIEAPYVRCPAGPADLARNIAWAEQGRAAIVPGVSYLSEDRADVMRGEEVQVLGALASGSIPADCLVCHPGTHNKWIHVDDGQIVSFRTVMTGELFSLLRKHSILSDLLSQPVEPDGPFEAGVRQGLATRTITSDLFSIRARVLLGGAAREEAASFASGLLIGADVQTGLAIAADSDIRVMGRPELTRLYRAALAVAGRSAEEIDGEASFLAGIKHIAETIE